MSKLYTHEEHWHRPKNPNQTHAEEQQKAGFNQKLAVWLTQHVGTMACAYLFAIIGVCGLAGAFTDNTSLVLIFGSISSYFLQLVLLPVILVGGNVLNRKQEIQADEQFATTMKTYHDEEESIKHLEAQDKELLKQTRMLLHIIANMQPGGLLAMPIDPEAYKKAAYPPPLSEPQRELEKKPEPEPLKAVSPIDNPAKRYRKPTRKLDEKEK